MLIPFAAASIASLWLLTRSKLASVLPISIFCLAYSVTTVIGASIISEQKGGGLWSLYGGVNATIANKYDGWTYFILLFAPLLLLPFFSLGRQQNRSFIRSAMSYIADCHIEGFSYGIVLVGFSAYCYVTLAQRGFLTLSAISSVQGDFMAAMQLRSAVFSNFSTIFFGMLYMGLPTLAHFALHQAIHRRSWRWRFVFLFGAGNVIVLTLLTVQKAPVLVFLLSLAVGYSVLTGTRVWILLGASLGGFALLNTIQFFLLGDWTALQGFYLVIFRMASGFPYYVKLYPRVLPFTGLDGLDMLGLIPHRHTSADVFNQMYPEVFWVQGNAPAPAHVDAYAQAGVWYALCTVLLIGAYLRLLCWLKSKAATPLGYVLYIQGIVSAYYLTQVTVRDAIMTGYGVIWVALPVLTLVALQRLFELAVVPTRAALPLGISNG